MTEILGTAASAATAALAERYRNGHPFPHVLVDEFFEPAFARALLDGFPAAHNAKPNRFGSVGLKAFHPDLTALGEAYAEADRFFASPDFLDWMSRVTGIDALLYDPTNYGGGTHENFGGRDLRPHVDFNIHPVTKLHRRINLIVYLNETWDPTWGGAIALYRDPRDPLTETAVYQPIFNRGIIFETSERSWHGFDELNFPEQSGVQSRKSLSIYLYTKERPADEIYGEHTTFYVPRPLPRHYVAGRTLTEQDERELGALIGHRDRLIELYQDEQRKRDDGTVEAARLRQRCAELEAARGLPALGYIRASNVRGGYGDGWVARELTFDLHAERAVEALVLRIRTPQALHPDTYITIEAGGECWLRTRVTDDLMDLTAAVPIAQHDTVQVRVTIDASVNLNRLGLGPDERDLGFFLESLSAEHGERAKAPAAPGELAFTDPAPERIAFLGDSAVRLLDGLSFTDLAQPDRRIVTRARWRQYFRTASLFENGRFTDTATRMLWELDCIATDLHPQPLFAPTELVVQQNVVRSVYFRPVMPRPAIVFSCGGVNAWDLEDELYPERWFALDDPPEGIDQLPEYRASTRVPYSSVVRTIEERLAPLFTALQALRDAGYPRLYVLGLTPPHTVQRPHRKPAALQYAVRITQNRVYERLCAACGIGFIPTWDILSMGGLRDAALFADTEHVNLAGAARIVNRVHSVMS